MDKANNTEQKQITLEQVPYVIKLGSIALQVFFRFYHKVCRVLEYIDEYYELESDKEKIYISMYKEFNIIIKPIFCEIFSNISLENDTYNALQKLKDCASEFAKEFPETASSIEREIQSMSFEEIISSMSDEDLIANKAAIRKEMEQAIKALNDPVTPIEKKGVSHSR